MMANGMTAEQKAERMNAERGIRLEIFPPQEGVCLHCTKPLDPFSNRDYNGTTKGYCNKMCRKNRCRKLISEGMSIEEAEAKCWIEW